MKQILFIILMLALLPGSGSSVKAAHLIGGELSYRCLGGNDFEISLVMYRDCNCPPDVNCADFFDPFAYLYFSDEAGSLVNIPSLFNSPILEIQFNAFSNETDVLPEDDVCIASLPDLCIKRGVYRKAVTLPARPGGYKVKFQRCCRNQTIQNIVDPGGTGATWEIAIPHTVNNSCNNSSPTFNNLPPVVICQDFDISFDHSATDADGDSLVYELCTPFDGAEPNCPYIDPVEPGPDCQFDGAPYPHFNIQWATGYSEGDPLGGGIGNTLTIDPVTGFLSGSPTTLGQFVVGVCVSEYRNGVLLSTNKRDFQFNVTDCLKPTAIPSLTAEINADGIWEDTYCTKLDYFFDNGSSGASTYYWDFGDPTTTTDFSTEQYPSYEYPDTGQYLLTLYINPGEDCADTAQMLLNLYPVFLADFNFIEEGCAYEAFQFIDQSQGDIAPPNLWYWDFGDGTTIGPGSGPITGVDHTEGTFADPIHYFQTTGDLEVDLVSFSDLGCDDFKTYVITVHPVPVAEISHDFLCLDLPTEFTGSTQLDNIVSWEWNLEPSGMQSGQTVSQNYTIPGDYSASLFVESAEGCRDTAVFDFTIYPTLFADAGPDLETCLDVPIQLDASASSGGAGLDGNSYSWEPAEYVVGEQLYDSFVIPPSDQTFTLTVSDPNGCNEQDEVFVKVWPLPDVDAGLDVDVCDGITDTQLNGSVENTVIQTWWSPPMGLSDTSILNPTVVPLDTTSYVLTGLDIRGCENTDTVVVQLIPDVDPLVLDVQPICEGDSIQLFASGGAVFSWSPVENISDPNVANPVVWPIEDVTYSVNIANPPCFDADVDVDMTVHPLPYVYAGEDATINVGEIIQLMGEGDQGTQWSPDYNFLDSLNTPDPNVQPFYTTDYVLMTLSDQGCKNYDTVRIEVTDDFLFVIPNAFSPNGDGNNDRMGVLLSLGIMELIEFKIFNRWGELVWEAASIDDRWDGTIKGNPAPIGVYVYSLVGKKWRDEDLLERGGSITLIR